MRMIMLAALAMFAVSGCGQPNIRSNYDLAGSSRSGVASGSITYAGNYGAYTLRVSGANGTKYFIQHGHSQTLNPLKAFMGETPNPHLGKTGAPFAIELPAGEYSIDGWTIDSGPAHVQSTQPTDIFFRVRAGQAIYLGNFDFLVTDTVMRNPAKAEVTLWDRLFRDQAAIRKTFPALATVPMAEALRPGTVLQNVGGQSSGRLTLYIPIPVK